MKEKFQEIILLINENNFVKAEEIFENLLMREVTKKIINKKNKVISELKLGNLNG